jgi:hypothetical protein
MKPLDQWPLWGRATLWNVCCAGGIFLGFASSAGHLSAKLEAGIAVSAAALMNVMFLSVRPRILAEKADGKAANVWRIAYRVLTERPLILALVILQLIVVARCTAATIVLARTSMGAYVASLPNAHHVTQRLIGGSVSIAFVTALWTCGAVGLWRNRRWAWWLALILNGLAATVAAIFQVLLLDQFQLDVPATVAVVLLLLPAIRKRFSRSRNVAAETVG